MSILQNTLDYVNECGEHIDADTIVEYVSSITKSANSALVQLSGIRKALKLANKEELADNILLTPLYKTISSNAKEEATKSLIDNEDHKQEINTLGSTILGDYADVYKKLVEVVDGLVETNRDVNIYDFVYAIINFTARPIDVLDMKFDGDLLTNWGKSRDKASTMKYVGFLNIDQAKILLSKIQQHYTNIDKDIVITQARRATMRVYALNPRDLRRISSKILVSTEVNRIKRIHKQQEALRHKNPTTSILYYQ
jgi:hypothetical protein